MLKAKDFIDIDSSDIGAESRRLEALHAQIATQDMEVKTRLTEEFLVILENRSEKLGKRVLACAILGGRRRELGITGSRKVIERLRSVLTSEFFGPNFEILIKNTPLIRFDNIRFTFLKAILLTLLRIDFNNEKEFVGKIAHSIDPVQGAALLMDLDKMHLTGQ